MRKWRKDFTLSAKQRDNLAGWEYWEQNMKLLRAIHLEIASKKAALSGDV
jgi:hypothetical protein